MSFIREPNAEPIPGYRLIEPLGSGGFGEVWKCEAPGGLFKAIKFVYGNLNSVEEDAAGAEQEHKALQRIKEVRHPFVLSMDRIEVVDGELVIVMELADKSLHDYYVECQAAGMVGIPRDDLLRFLRDAAEALDHMIQKHHLQHLDVKPRNLFLISDRVKVADFGLVKQLERHGGSGLMMGVTPLYASPETFNSKISEHSDQYSLAIVYQELLTGQRPFNGRNVRQLAVQHMSEPPELRVLPEAERPAVARALSKNPSDRFPSCLEFMRALYTAWTPPRPERVAAHAESGVGQRPKTMADTLENFQLESRGEDGAGGLEPIPALDDASTLGLTVAQPDTGALRPAIILGIGTFGRRAIRELRCRLLDRFGDLEKTPLFRFLYVDIDPEAIKIAMRGTADVALNNGEVYHLPLQSAGNYRRRMLDQLSEWLPREKMYAIPRSLVAHGQRALGRLAFADNYLRFLARLRRELQMAVHPDTLFQSVNQTGLALRDNLPRVYVIAAAGGGGSGFLVDLGYALRRLLQQLEMDKAEVNTLLYCGAPSDPATPPAEQANLYATLTELHHFSDPSVPFAAQYSADGPRLIEQGPPFASVYLLAPNHRSPAALRDTLAHVGSYLFHDLTTPLGLRLDRGRQKTPPPSATRFRSFGTYSVWFPRGLMLRLAARQAILKLLDNWQAGGSAALNAAEVKAACAAAWSEAGLNPEAMVPRVREASQGVFDGGIDSMLGALQADLEEQTVQPRAANDPVGWARETVRSVLDWVGMATSGEETGRRTQTVTGDWNKSRLSRSLSVTIVKLAETADRRLGETIAGFVAQPGRRLAAAEDTITTQLQICDEFTTQHRALLKNQAALTDEAWQKLEDALQQCVNESGGFRLFAGRSVRKLLRAVIEQLIAFARQRLAEDMQTAVHQFYAALRGRLNERLRDLSFCRQRLRSMGEALMPLQEHLETTPPYSDIESTPSISPTPSPESFWEEIRETTTVQVVLPGGERDLERAANRYLATLKPEQFTELDRVMHDRVLSLHGGLLSACSSKLELVKGVAAPLIDQAVTHLGAQLPITDVAQVEQTFPEAAHENLPSWILTYFKRAVPLVLGKEEADHHSFLLLPAGEAGRLLGEKAKQVIADLNLVRVPGQADLMFCREQGFLAADDLKRTFDGCRAAYEAASSAPVPAPHSRFDIVDWLPFDP